MAFLENVPSPTNHQEPQYKFLVDELFTKLDGANKTNLGHYRTVSEKKAAVIETFIKTFRIHIGDDIFPTARLIFPDKDGRLYYIRDVTLARLIVKMYRIPSESEDYQVLYHWKHGYQKAKRFSVDSSNLRDLPLRASRIIANRRETTVFSDNDEVPKRRTYSVPELNAKLDSLNYAKKSNEQIAILKPILDSVSIPEVRWFLHILLKKSILVRFESFFLQIWHPDGAALFEICNNLQKTFNYLLDPSVRLKPEELNVHPRSPFRPQLSFKLTKNYDKLIKDMAISVPMDENFQKMYKSNNLHGKFYMEEKMDGDRMVLHKEGKQFKFYSRRLKDYSFLYGENYEIGSLTKYLIDAFPKKVDSIILDGEMVAWDFKRNVVLPFGTLKSSAIQESVRQYTTIDQYEQQSSYPFFLVFDVLHINGTNLTNHPLFFRKDLLQKIINPIPHRLEILPAVLGSTPDDIKNAIKKVVSSRSEGIVVKHVQSKYFVGERNPHWVKVKPEYLEKFGENLDLTVIGKIPGVKISYMCGLKNDDDQIFYSFCTCGNGFTEEEYDKIERITHNKWIAYKDQLPPSKVLKFGNKKPMHWIHPRDSLVLEIKARSIDCTIEKTYAVGTTLHNLYCRSIREDKSIHDCTTISEYRSLKERYSTDVEKSQSANKKRRVMENSFVQTRQPKAVKVESELFKGFTFVILSDKVSENGERISRDELINLVKKYGGTITNSLDKFSEKQYIVVTERELPTCKGYLEKGVDLIKPNWLFECINRNTVVQLEPIFIYNTKHWDLFKHKQDEFGDSYIIHQSITDLKSCKFLKLTDRELSEYRYEFIDDLEKLQIPVPQCFLFNGVKFHIISLETSDFSYQDLKDRIERFGGKVLDSYQGCSFIVVTNDAENQNRKSVLKKVNNITKSISDALEFEGNVLTTRIPSVVREGFIKQCIKRNVLLDADDYKFV
ncbi:DNA ligase IV [Scheffersomyces xylosifermentans]|uniref:DNA ligase IV n=1 Tax=Scheffersomyces xylosifermentans TaxID=1304137 RepID=UPI00315C77EF